jgi:multidrug resistance efflux pump
MRRYYVVCAGVTAVLAGITMYFSSEPTKFYGIADTKETIINAYASVEIRKIPVVQGQTVTAGDTLVVLDRPELVLKINEISHMLSEYKARKIYQTTSSRSEVKQIQAEQAERINEITAKIRELEAQYEMNRKLVAELRSLKKEESDLVDSTDNPILAQIKSLRSLLESAKNPSQIQIERINKQLTTADDPLAAQVQRLSDELSLLQKEQSKLVICAQMNGMIGTVKFKEGEKVSPFDTILTLHEAAPSYVKGYIHENVYSHVAVGDTVRVVSFSDDRQGFAGRVVGVGSRIVDYPERLRKRQDIPIWGREVVIKIPENNSFLLGEKVLISVMTKKKSIFSLQSFTRR